MEPTAFATVTYGLEQRVTLDRLDVKPRQLITYYGDTVGGRRWRAYGCEAEGAYQAYVMLFADESLIAVTTMEAAHQAWDSTFPGWSDFKEPVSVTLPDVAGFAALGAALVDSRLDLANHDFATVNEAREAREPGAIGTVAMVVLNPFMWIAWPVVVGMLPVGLWMHAGFLEEYEHFLERVEALQGGESTDAVIAELGEPERRVVDGADEVLVYRVVASATYGPPTSLGFSGDRLLWVGWECTPVPIEIPRLWD